MSSFVFISFRRHEFCIHFLSCSFHFAFISCHVAFISFHFTFMSFHVPSLCIKDTGLRKLICSNRTCGYPPKHPLFFAYVVLLSLSYRFGGLCRLPFSGFMNMCMYKFVIVFVLWSFSGPVMRKPSWNKMPGAIILSHMFHHFSAKTIQIDSRRPCQRLLVETHFKPPSPRPVTRPAGPTPAGSAWNMLRPWNLLWGLAVLGVGAASGGYMNSGYCMWTNVYICMYVRLYVCMYVCMSACMYVCMSVWMKVCKHACMHVCLYVCM